jgi:hypothetical protein
MCATVPQEQLGAGKRKGTGGQEHAIAGAVSILASQQCASVTISIEYAHTVLAAVSGKQVPSLCNLNVFVAVSTVTAPTERTSVLDSLQPSTMTADRVQ